MEPIQSSQQQLQMAPQLSQQQQQQHDATPQDVLAEARMNLQRLIDSGMSKELLHQLVDGGSQSLQLLAPSYDAPLAPQQQHQQPTIAQPQSMPAPPPPPPQCPPPPIPVSAPSRVLTASHAMKQQAMSTAPEVKMEDGPTSWPSAPVPLMRPAMNDADRAATAMYMASLPLNHRARISVSSTASGSSGHASIWSNNSAQSALSWHSASTAPSVSSALTIHPSNAKSSAAGPSPTAFNIGPPPMPATVNMNKHNIYWCTSCETSFKRKYDWKRHEDEFHERWRKYPCPEPGCNRSFWGSNSFNQHHKQCHGCKTCPHAEKVVKFLRKRKYWACGFCSALHPARERHVEHVARHFESGLTKTDWMHSRVVYGLLHQPLIHEAWDALVVSKQSEYGSRRPQFSWHPSKTGRAQGFLEKENAGQLQDLLEFFSGDEGEAQWIVSVAYKLADVIMSSPPATIQSPTQTFTPETMVPSPFAQDTRMSFAPLQSQQVPQLHTIPSEREVQQSSFSTFRSPPFIPSQQFSGHQQPSPASSTQSPISSQSPTGLASQNHMDHRDLPATSHPSSSTRSEASDNVMDYEFSSAPIVFEDWESLNGVMIDESGPQQPHNWGLPVQYYDPTVRS